MNRFARTGEIADPCWVPLSRCTSVPSGRCSGRFQPPPDRQQHPATVSNRLDRTNHELPRDGVKELLDIEIDHPVILPAPLPAYPDRVVGRLLRAIAIGVLVKPRLHQWLQKHGWRRLRDPTPSTLVPGLCGFGISTALRSEERRAGEEGR